MEKKDKDIIGLKKKIENLKNQAKKDQEQAANDLKAKSD